MMTNRETYLAHPDSVRVVRDYQGAAEGITHTEACPHFNPAVAQECGVYGTRADGSFGPVYPKTSKENGPTSLHTDCISEGGYSHTCRYNEPLYMQTTHIGLVLRTGEYNGYDDSDFYAEVWNEEKGAPERITYASTRGWTYPNNAHVDATPDIVAKYEAWCEKARQAELERRRIAHEAQQAEERAHKARLDAAHATKRDAIAGMKGKRVRTKGTKSKPSVEGTLFWVGVSGSGKTVRVGVKDDVGQVTWTSLDRVSLV